MTLDEISEYILNVPDFPKPGVLFKDITPILQNGDVFKALIQKMAEKIPAGTNKIIAIESRGFILGSAIAHHVGIGLVLLRKPGKLPRETFKESYQLEYGSDSLEMHKDAIGKGDKVSIVDDVLATGGTASAAERLCEKSGAQVMASIFLMEIKALNGRSRLKNKSISLF